MTNLTEILKKDLIKKYPKGHKPILKLTQLENTAVNSRTQEEYDELMRVYELGGWEWADGDLPTKGSNLWDENKEETCVDAGIASWKGRGKFQFRSKYYSLRLNIISTQEFYKKQKITPNMIKEINKYFDGGR